MPSPGLIENPLAAFGLAADIGSQTMEYFRNVSATTITRGDCVVLEFSQPSTTTYPGNVAGKNVSTTTTAHTTNVIGVANETAGDGSELEVITRGVCTFANATNTIGPGSQVGTSATAGRLTTATGTAVVGEVIGMVVGTTSSSNVATVYLYKA